MNAIQVTKKDVEFITSKTFPNYTGKKFQIEITDKVTFSSTYWHGGSKHDYAFLQLTAAPKVAFPDTSMHPMDNVIEGKTVTIPQGMAVVCHSRFCGKDMGLTIYANSADVVHLVPADNSDVSRDEKIVLVAIKSTKASYAGVSNYRFHRANRESGITLDQWNTAKDSCIQKGFLDKRGALTIQGKNLVSGVWRLDSI